MSNPFCHVSVIGLIGHWQQLLRFRRQQGSRWSGFQKVWEKMPLLPHGTIDCDVHPAIPSTASLMPYLDDYWAEMVRVRGIDRTVMNLSSYPPTAPLSTRPDWRSKEGRAGADPKALAAHLLDPMGIGTAILNPLHGAIALHSGEMAAAFCTAINRYVSEHWLDRDPRLRASIVVPLEDPELAAQEIDRCAGDPRFVQVLILAGLAAPLGKKRWWPIYEAANRHGLPIGVHAGSTYRFPTAPIGWGSYYLEDYVNSAQTCESQLVSLIAEGVFAQFPELKVVFIESGFMWLPAAMWRASKTWRGVRAEVPWIREDPATIIRRHFRFTLQPVDEPPTADQFATVMEQLGSDELLLFSTDYPHWQFDEQVALPGGLTRGLVQKLCRDNPLATYGRLAVPTIEEVTI